MKSYKKLLMSGVALLTAFSLTACGGNDTKDSSKGESTDGKQTLTVSVDGDGYKEYIESIKGDFESENNAEVKVVVMAMTDQADALALDGPAGTGPDVFIAPYDRVGSMGSQGHLAEVTTQPEGITDTESKLVTFEGKQYGTPFVIETLVGFYNKDLISEMPKDFSEVEALTKDSKYAFASESGKNTAFLAKWTDFYFSYGLVAGYGGYAFGSEGTDPTDIGLNNEGTIDAIKYAKTWYDQWPKGMQDVTGSGDFITEMFTTGKTAIIIDGPWMASTYKDAGVNYGVGAIPTLPNGEKFAAFGGGKAWVASSYAQNPELAAKWLEYVGNADNSTKFFEATNEIPANTIAREAVPADNELAQAVIVNFENASPMPNIQQMAEVWDGGQYLMFDAVSGAKTPEQSAEDTVKNIKESIEQKYK